MTSDQFFGLEKDNPYDHVREARWWLEKEPPRSIHTWEDLVSKFINEFFPPSRTTNLRNEISNFQQRFDESFHEAWDRYKDLLRACPHHGGNLLERRNQDVLTIIENKSKPNSVNQQTSAVTTVMTAILRKFQATPPPASTKAVEETCVTCGGAYPYYQCLAAGGNTFPELRDNIQGYVSAAAVNYNQGNPSFCLPGIANQIRPPGFAQPNMQNNQNRFSPPQGFNRGNNFNHEHSYQAPAQQNQNIHLNELKKVRRMNKANMKSMQTQIDMTSLSNQINEIKNMMASLLQINTASTSESGSLPNNTVANPKGKLKAITTRSGLVIDRPTIPTPPQSINPQLSCPTRRNFKNWPPLNENCSAVILKKLPEKLGDPGKFLIPCGFSELKCKALADLGTSINLMPLSIWKKLCLPELISTRMTLELANRAICTPAGIARDVFVLVGKFTFPADSVIVDYESDPRVPFILGRPFLRTARALIDVYGEEMILRDGDERLILNMRHDTSSYSNQPQRESINLINVFNNLRSHVLSEKLLDLDSTKDLHPPHHDDTLSGNTTFSSNPLLEEFVDELAFPPKYDDDLQFDIESDLKEIEFLLHQDIDSSLKDSIDLANPADNVVDSVIEMFIDEHALDYSSPLIFDEYDDKFLEIESDAENVYDDSFDFKGEKIKEVDALPSTNNEDKIFNPCILIQEKYFEIITRVVRDKKLATSNASSMLEDFDPPFYEPLFFKEVLSSKMLLLFSSKN
nr:reverse transcriptase domain-containing protein [Tanacetum cinerariifolium]